MSAILDQIKRNAVPAAMLRTASKGALPLPGPEMIEILVYLTHNPVFAQDARMTLAGWDLQSAMEAVSRTDAPAEVLGYYWSEQNRRPSLMPSLIENPAVTENMLMELACEAPREIIAMLLASTRVRNLPGVIEALSTNPRILPAELQALHGEPPLNIQPESAEAGAGDSEPGPGSGKKQAFPEFPVVPESQYIRVTPTQRDSVSSHVPVSDRPEATSVYAELDPETEAIRIAWEKQYAAEIAAAESEPFELMPAEEEASSPETAESSASRNVHDEAASQAALSQETFAAAETDSSLLAGSELSSSATAISALSLHNKAAAIEAKKLTIMQRIGRMKASERIKTAFIGGKEERAFLIRDRARIVQNAVLSSPKITDAEVEVFAAAKNLDENVLREIARNRRFMKNYPVVRNLATNPKTPLDVAMPLVKMLMVFDLKSLQKSKSVSEIIRKMAQKYYQEKATSGGKTKS
jgi:hypothetical protein